MSRAIEMPPSLLADGECPLYQRMYEQQRSFYGEKATWILDGVENFNYTWHMKLGFGFTGLSVDRKADCDMMADMANRKFKEFCRQIEEYIVKGIRHHEVVNADTDDAYVMQYAGGLNDDQIPELTEETAQLRLVRSPCLIPIRASIDSDLPESQAYSIAFTLTPTLGREIDLVEVIR